MVREKTKKASRVDDDMLQAVTSDKATPPLFTRIHTILKNPIAVTGVIVLALLIGVGGYMALSHQSKPKQQTDTAPKVIKYADYRQSFDKELQAAKDDVAKAGTPTTQAQKDALALKYVDLGTAYRNKNDVDNALAAFNKAIELSPASKWKALTGIYYVNAYNGRPAAAIKAGDELVALLKSMLPTDDVSVHVSIDKYTSELQRLKAGQSL